MSEQNPLLLQSPTINPYRYGLIVIWKRLLWDLRLESWRSRKKLKACKNQFMGEKAVIICNGPSLLKSNLSLLSNVFTFGLNKINLLFDKSNFRPSCIVSVNSFVIEQNTSFFNKTKIPLFLSSAGISHIRSRSNVTFLHASAQNKFAKDCSLSIMEGHTVTFVAMQLAFHMGFADVALIGCDHNFSTKGPANMTVTSGTRDENHFDPNYFAGGVKWQLPDLVGSEMAYYMARNIYEAHDRRIINCTEGGKLDVFERQSLQSWLL